MLVLFFPGIFHVINTLCSNTRLQNILLIPTRSIQTLSKSIAPNESIPGTVKDSLLELTDHCVSCGMCLPSCPTYALANAESESPRGRIALIRAILQEHIDAGEKAQEHLDHCLLCRRCERICPANVSYAELMDGMREYLQKSPGRKKGGAISRLVYTALRSRKRWSAFLLLGLRLERSGILAAVSRISSGRVASDIQRLRTRILPMITRPEPLRSHYSAIGTSLGEVALFTGCMQEWVSADTIRSAITVLTRMGYAVYVPEQQQCCGAMHVHGGYRQQACDLQLQNRELFKHLPIQAIIGLSSACVVGLTENACDTPMPAQLKVFEFCDFLTSSPGLQRLSFKPMPRTLLLHVPCTHKNVLRKEYQVEQVLRLVPGIDVVPLPADNHCCGAAGIYMFENPVVADQLGMRALERAGTGDFDEMVTTNIGCSLHLRGLLLQGDGAIRLSHPADILCKAMGKD